MIKVADLPETIPIFPLPGALLLPRAKLPLHIFEPRYLQMLEDVLKTKERVIGMIQPNGGRTGDGTGLQAIGCAGRVTQFSETEDGRYFITLCGVSRYRVKQEIDGFTPYRRCTADWAGFEADLGKTERDDAFDRSALMALLGRYLEAGGLSTDWGALDEAEDELLVNSLSMLLDFDPEDKQALLEAPSLTTRRETLVTLMEFALRGGSLEEKLQ
ncbi:LON peptidase substrate-binding domain-containing protein [Tritonibacter horizontis]|uniref:Lon protease 2 n=1 Tax=Tritonibacter horizontis TaxID=1768241 RepID=A0A132C4W5_9RHOB|nr:LON peptidase substrate-binding domain-containing protein [Tritonibacter horizontis]KUP95037.1 Lon protease 2 [Tritonibacter horizontis]